MSPVRRITLFKILSESDITAVLAAYDVLMATNLRVPLQLLSLLHIPIPILALTSPPFSLFFPLHPSSISLSPIPLSPHSPSPLLISPLLSLSCHPSPSPSTLTTTTRTPLPTSSPASPPAYTTRPNPAQKATQSQYRARLPLARTLSSTTTSVRRIRS
jgi:hypothetical protein